MSKMIARLIDTTFKSTIDQSETITKGVYGVGLWGVSDRNWHGAENKTQSLRIESVLFALPV